MAPVSKVVYAFEALPDNQNLLMKNVKENSLEQKILIFPVAVGEKETLVTFYGASTGGSFLMKTISKSVNE